MIGPTDCKLCGQPCYNIEGFTIGEVLIFQFIHGRMVLATVPQIGYALLHIHTKCIEEVNERV